MRATDLSDECSFVDYKSCDENLEFQCVDLLDYNSVQILMENIDWVFHIAGLFSFEASLDELKAANAEVVQNMVRVAKEKGVKGFLHVSTCGVYGSPQRSEKHILDENTQETALDLISKNPFLSVLPSPKILI